MKKIDNSDSDAGLSMVERARKRQGDHHQSPYSKKTFETGGAKRGAQGRLAAAPVARNAGRGAPRGNDAAGAGQQHQPLQQRGVGLRGGAQRRNRRAPVAPSSDAEALSAQEKKQADDLLAGIFGLSHSPSSQSRSSSPSENPEHDSPPSSPSRLSSPSRKPSQSSIPQSVLAALTSLKKVAILAKDLSIAAFNKMLEYKKSVIVTALTILGVYFGIQTKDILINILSRFMRIWSQSTSLFTHTWSRLTSLFMNTWSQLTNLFTGASLFAGESVPPTHTPVPPTHTPVPPVPTHTPVPPAPTLSIFHLLNGHRGGPFFNRYI
ncbi:MAG: hypothetical protein LBQ23_02690 [Puniceicoccales bacterium]|jgi:hypothetical protein|nr:hypothetical protein [Puniceicoccales bacterium]